MVNRKKRIIKKKKAQAAAQEKDIKWRKSRKGVW